ncbi:helix-turn-helix domain-containing protein [Actinomycetospora straminea]|uniref:AraC family transcriptional regulator n=1 Tax=Actinomycetospora straminea TaxID=663607 RepID=A0ABP9EGF0_9PSEU|nr:helix-turn-helix domain-containing protein [Actinomycetospora straminea]MDD7933400.1 helix-turn-helix domain-containing protein [Actinomycetospora straminea]
MGTIDALLGTVRVEEPAMRADTLAPGRATVPAGGRWALVAVARGEADLGDGALHPGDAVLLRGADRLAVRAGDEGATLLVAEFALRGAAPRLALLPARAVVRADSEFCRLLVARVTDQLDAAPTSDVVSTRLLDWLVTDTVRDVLTAAAGEVTATDPGVAAALAAIHDDPSGPWTVARLAAHAGVSRAAFARRFREEVGTSPLSYLREHRFDLAERALVTEPDATVAAVARRVGYANPFSFSTAFHRHRGHAPSAVRRAEPSTASG